MKNLFSIFGLGKKRNEIPQTLAMTPLMKGLNENVHDAKRVYYTQLQHYLSDSIRAEEYFSGKVSTSIKTHGYHKDDFIALAGKASIKNAGAMWAIFNSKPHFSGNLIMLNQMNSSLDIHSMSAREEFIIASKRVKGAIEANYNLSEIVQKDLLNNDSLKKWLMTIVKSPFMEMYFASYRTLSIAEKKYFDSMCEYNQVLLNHISKEQKN